MRRRNVAYIRAAKEDEFAVEQQKQCIDDYATEHNLKIDYYYIDNGYSGRNLDRPQLRQLLRDVKSKKVTDRIIIQNCSRIGRDIFVIDEILRKISKTNVKLISTLEMETSQINLSTSVLRMFREDKLKKRIFTTKYNQQRRAVIYSPYKKGTTEDNDFCLKMYQKYKQKGVDEIQFKYREERGIRNESR